MQPQLYAQPDSIRVFWNAASAQSIHRKALTREGSLASECQGYGEWWTCQLGKEDNTEQATTASNTE
jgi:hypothetical protein